MTGHFAKMLSRETHNRTGACLRCETPIPRPPLGRIPLFCARCAVIRKAEMDAASYRARKARAA